MIHVILNRRRGREVENLFHALRQLHSRVVHFDPLDRRMTGSVFVLHELVEDAVWS
jgi:hypothetical protein